MDSKVLQSRNEFPAAESGLRIPANRTKIRLVLYSALLVMFALLISPKPNDLNLVFPVFAIIAGCLILDCSAASYLAFTLWLWFLVPMLRRIVDVRSAYDPAGTILLSSYVASCVPIYHLLWASRKVLDRYSAPLFYMSAAVLYGLLVGLTRYSTIKSLQAVITWMAPLTFAFFIYQNRNRFNDLFRAFELTMIWGTLFMGAYGIVQYFLLPPWDATWMLNVNNVTFGVAQARELRVFSTMNSPQWLGIYLAVGILISLHSKDRVRVLAVPVGVISLIFTMARSTWISFLVGFLYLIIKGSFRLRIQILIVVLVSVFGVLLALQNPGVEKTISARMNSFSDVGDDVSFVSRAEGYEALSEGIIEKPFGLGLGGVQTGSPTSSHEDSITHDGKEIMQADSTIASILIPFGFPGTLLAVGSFLIIGYILISLRAPRDSSAETLKMVALVMLTLVPLDDVVNGPSGFLFWSIAGLIFAARSRQGQNDVRKNYVDWKATPMPDFVV